MSIKEKLLTLPKKPGVYMHKDKDGNIIYVGKAINLFNRVNSYFKGVHDYKTTKLVMNIDDFDYIVTKSEKEALILEYNLIKEYDPKFNVVFKDDKSYPYILLKDSIEPHVSVIRLNKKSKYKGKIFGPFPDVKAARNTVELINKIYPTRKCHNLNNKLCLYYHLGQCLGYCQNKIDDFVSSNMKNEISKILNGDCNDLINQLKKDMNNHVENLDYEKAAYYRDLINDVKTTILKQDVQVNHKEEFDVFNYAVEDGYIAITGLFIKNGKIFSHHKYIDFLVGDPDNFFTSFVYQFYSINPKPKKLYIPKEYLNYFTDIINCSSVTKGYKYQLLKQAKTNCLENLKQNKEIIIKKENYIDELSNEFMRICHKQINRIELFDNSHISGTNTVGAMVVYENFKQSKKDYRLYKLEDSNNDLNSMKEMIYRRYFKVLKENLEKPDLIIVDGGTTQIDIAYDIIKSLNLDILVMGLGKNEKHNTSYLMDHNHNVINIDKNTNLFFFLTNMQDEVHRFAITYHRKLRTKSTYKSILDNIEGLGPKSKLKLLRKYKSINNLKTLELDELCSILSKKVAERLYNKLRDYD